MNIYQFMGEHPILTVFIVYIIGQVILILGQRAMRVFSLMKNGYPPSHCDADGDFKND